MAVNNNLAVLMAKNKKFSAKKLSEETGINKNTLTALKHNKSGGIQYDTLEILCNYFKVDIGEFLQLNKEAS